MRFSHPHLLSVLGIDNLEDTNRFFFEYCYISVESLINERIGTNKLFPEDDLLALLKGVTSALAYL